MLTKCNIILTVEKSCWKNCTRILTDEISFVSSIKSWLKQAVLKKKLTSVS